MYDYSIYRLIDCWKMSWVAGKSSWLKKPHREVSATIEENNLRSVQAKTFPRDCTSSRSSGMEQFLGRSTPPLMTNLRSEGRQSSLNKCQSIINVVNCSRKIQKFLQASVYSKCLVPEEPDSRSDNVFSSMISHDVSCHSRTHTTCCRKLSSISSCWRVQYFTSNGSCRPCKVTGTAEGAGTACDDGWTLWHTCWGCADSSTLQYTVSMSTSVHISMNVNTLYWFSINSYLVPTVINTEIRNTLILRNTPISQPNSDLKNEEFSRLLYVQNAILFNTVEETVVFPSRELQARELKTNLNRWHWPISC